MATKDERKTWPRRRLLPEDAERFREAAIAMFRELGCDELFVECVRLYMAGIIPNREGLTSAEWATMDRCFETFEQLTAKLLDDLTPIH